MRLSAVLVALLAAHSANAYVYLQCTTLLITQNLLQNLVNVVTTLLSPANSYTGCPTYCENIVGSTYSLYQPGIAGLAGTCFCTDISPAASYVTSGSNAGGSCAGGTYQINYLPSHFWQFNTCSSGSTLSGGPAAFLTTDDASCFTSCTNYKYLMMTSNNAGQYSCQCGDTLTPGSSATCNRNIQQIYSNMDPNVSGVARRSKIARELARRQAENTLCPASQSACRIPGTQLFECLDTQSELESCGGCLSGVFDAAEGFFAPVGEVCTELPGVAVGGVSCVKGRCKVSACKKGFTLKAGACVAV